MALANQCDRCKKLYTRAYVPDIRVNVYHHGYGDSWVDLCDECTKQLERFIKGESVNSVNKKENNNDELRYN